MTAASERSRASQWRGRRRPISALAACALLAGALAGCGGGDEPDEGADGATSTATATGSARVDGVVDIGGRGLYMRCAGSGSPTVVMEAGDGDTSGSYSYAEQSLAGVTRTCVYDRANLGLSDPAPGPRGLGELTGDLEALLEAGDVPPPYVLVGSSGGGYIVAGYAVEHQEEVAGVVLVDTAMPFRNPPPGIVAETDPDNPDNVEHRDYLQVEKDAWAARRSLGPVPVRVLSADFPADEEALAETASERRATRQNVPEQRGWLALSPLARQVVAQTGHDIGAEDPELLIGQIRNVVEEARASG